MPPAAPVRRTLPSQATSLFKGKRALMTLDGIWRLFLVDAAGTAVRASMAKADFKHHARPRRCRKGIGRVLRLAGARFRVAV